MDEIYIVGAARTAIGKFGGTIAKTPAAELGAIVIRDVLKRAGVAPDQISEVIMGQVLAAGVGQNPARQAAIKAGVPYLVPAMTINKVCGSGLQAAMLGAQAIANGDADVVVAGGQESMSLAPHAMNGSRDGFRMGDAKLVDTMIVDGLWDVYNQYHMGSRRRTWRRNTPSRAKTRTSSPPRARTRPRRRRRQAGSRTRSSRSKCRRAKARSCSRTTSMCATARRSTRSRRSSRRSTRTVALPRQCIRHQRRRRRGRFGVREKSARARAAPDRAHQGVRLSRRRPEVHGMGPVPASKRCLARAGWEPKDLDLMEINEAFAAQAIAVNRQMGWDTSKVNVNGGAIALGHPIGASGCRVLVTLLHEMAKRDAKRGLASLCIGGGMGVALAVER